jgi:hypothetical protein
MRAGDDVGRKEEEGGYGAAGERDIPSILRSSQANRIQDIRLYAAGNTALPIGTRISLSPAQTDIDIDTDTDTDTDTGLLTGYNLGFRV